MSTRLRIVDFLAGRVQVAQRVVQVARLAIGLALGAHAPGYVHDVVPVLPPRRGPVLLVPDLQTSEFLGCLGGPQHRLW